MKRYKFLLEGNKSSHQDFVWEVGKWYTHEGEIELCEKGFHCSKGIYQAFSYVQGEILAEVEVKGEHLDEKDKEVWQQMRVKKLWKWQKQDSVLFSIYAAHLCLDNFEKVFPNDKRPRLAIEAAEKYAKEPIEENRLAAWSAAESAARSAAESAAWSATESAAESARSAAESARSAAWSAESAESARSARSAWSAARSAAWSARSAVLKKLDKWMLNHLKELEVLE